MSDLCKQTTLQFCNSRMCSSATSLSPLSFFSPATWPTFSFSTTDSDPSVRTFTLYGNSFKINITCKKKHFWNERQTKTTSNSWDFSPIVLRWSSTGIIASVFLIELDRFLAIRYPLKYPVFMTDERSIVACIGTQFGSLILCIIVRLASEETFSCTPICDGDLVSLPNQFKNSIRESFRTPCL